METLHSTFTDLDSIAWFFAIFLVASYVSWKGLIRCYLKSEKNTIEHGIEFIFQHQLQSQET